MELILDDATAAAWVESLAAEAADLDLATPDGQAEWRRRVEVGTRGVRRIELRAVALHVGARRVGPSISAAQRAIAEAWITRATRPTETGE